MVPSNKGNDSQRNHSQNCTKQPPSATRQKETSPIPQESDLSSSINTVEILSSNDILQAALRLSTILKYKTYQTNWNSCCMQNNISHISLT